MRKYMLIFLLLFPVLFLFGQFDNHRNNDLPCLNKEFNIFVHVVFDQARKTISKDDVKLAIDMANKNFAPICISFKFCEMDTVFNYNYNLINPINEFKELAVLYTNYNRINLFVVSGIITHPFVHSWCLGSIDSMQNANIIINDPFALSHELGHFFGLKDTYDKDRTELVDGSNCKTAGDKLCDTPADPYVPLDNPSIYVNRDCVFIFKKKDPNGEYYHPDVGNIMSYYLDCQCNFSYQQLKLMVENYLKAKNKHW